ncbi:nucleoside monophosphate kinase [Candidatus Gottesmanbacteria bacterium]|nr:nucleoside monophosphate kinase [Candidatus Gottesmanbacteria bacterium]
MHIIFYGPEGAGKGTQAKLLSEKLNLPILTSGDLVREAAANDPGLLGDICRRALHEGKYVADSEMFVLWKNRLKRKDMKKGWIMDGFPRNLNQAKFLTSKVVKHGYKIEKVFYLKITPKESMKRLLRRGRKLHESNSELHDSPERIKQRLEMYYQGERQVLDFFTKMGTLEEINGEQSIEKVHREIMSRIDRK